MNMNYKNCEGIPSIKPNTDGTPTLIIDKFAQPAPHVILGAANKLWNYFGEKSYWNAEFGKRSSCYGRTYEGNEVQFFQPYPKSKVNGPKKIPAICQSF